MDKESWTGTSFSKVCWWCLLQIIKICPCLSNLELVKVGTFVETWYCIHTKATIQTLYSVPFIVLWSMCKCMIREHCLQQNNGDGSFATPLPVKPRPTPASQTTPSAATGDRFGSLRREYASTQSLILGQAHRLVNQGFCCNSRLIYFINSACNKIQRKLQGNDRVQFVVNTWAVYMP